MQSGMILKNRHVQELIGSSRERRGFSSSESSGTFTGLSLLVSVYVLIDKIDKNHPETYLIIFFDGSESTVWS